MSLFRSPVVNSFAQSVLLVKLYKHPQRLVVDSIFRIIQEHARGLRRHPFAARRIAREQVAQVLAPYCLIVICERAPCGVSAHRSRARHLRSCSHLLHLSDQVRGFERVAVCGRARSSPHKRNPPRKALALSPARECGGSAWSFLTLPPPITVSSGSSAAIKRDTTSATCRRHFFLPWRSSPARPT